MSSGIIIQRAKVLLVAVTDQSLYSSLPTGAKAIVDAIDAKAPADRTENDVKALAKAIHEAVGH
jgi:hypothetical protein